jgi:hypothetical protein
MREELGIRGGMEGVLGVRRDERGARKKGDERCARRRRE